MTVRLPLGRSFRPLRWLAALLLATVQAATLGFGLTERPVRDADAHVEPAGISLHRAHSETACAACQALQHLSGLPARSAMVPATSRSERLPRREWTRMPAAALSDRHFSRAPPPVA